MGDFGSGFGNFSGNFAQKRVLKRNFEPKNSHQNTPPEIQNAHKCGTTPLLWTHSMRPYMRLPRYHSPAASIQNPLSTTISSTHHSSLTAHSSSLTALCSSPLPSPLKKKSTPSSEVDFLQSIILYIIYYVPSLCSSPAAS